MMPTGEEPLYLFVVSGSANSQTVFELTYTQIRKLLELVIASQKELAVLSDFGLKDAIQL